MTSHVEALRASESGVAQAARATDSPGREAALLLPVMILGTVAIAATIGLGWLIDVPPIVAGTAAHVVGSLLAIAMLVIGRRHTEGVDRRFRTNVTVIAIAWLVLQLALGARSMLEVSWIPPVELTLVLGIAIVSAHGWRIAVAGRFDAAETAAVHLDSAAVFLTTASIVLLALGRVTVSGQPDLVLLGVVTLLLGLSASLPILWLALAPLRGFHGWLVLLGGIPVLAAGLVWRALAPQGETLAADAMAACGSLLVGYGAATWTSRTDPSPAFRAVARRIRATLPLVTLAVAPMILVVNEVLRGRSHELLSIVVDLFIAAVLAIVIVRQTILLRERGRILADAEAAAGRERRLVNDLALSERRFRSLVQHSSDVFLIVSPDGNVIYQSSAIRGVLGYTAEERHDGQIFDFVHPDDARFLRTTMQDLASTPGATTTAEIRVRHADDSWRYIQATARNMIEDEVIGGIVVNYRDVTERRALEEQLRHSAFHDPLTGLANRALFVDRAQHALQRRGSEGRLAVLFMDLDDFKFVNDSFGHAAGDQVLIAVAERLTAALRTGDTVSRQGGDEFAVLLESADLALAQTVARRILDTLGSAFEVNGKEIHLAASIGIAVSALETRTADELLRNADVAMYMAKGRGKGRVELFESSMHEAVLTRLELKADLELAIERRELRLRYQPVFALQSGDLVGFEALVRWRHPYRGEVLPDEFIPLAEETGLILPIGAFVLQEACRQAQAWNATSPVPVHVSVNVSPRQLREPSVVDLIRRLMATTRLEPKHLIIELTESGLMQDDEGRLRDLKALGVHLALDDFGTGYSSLSYLSRFPIDILKVDQSFVSQLSSDGTEPALVRSVLQLGTAMGLYTVAEGIEHPHQLARLREMGVTYGQGYLLARPLDPIAATRLVGQRTTIKDMMAS